MGRLERRDCNFFCNRHVENFPLHQQREIRIGPLTMHRGHIFGRVNYFLSDCASISQGKDKHEMAVDMAVYMAVDFDHLSLQIGNIEPKQEQ